ncbi:esterase family protein, partial [Nocardia sp. NPDC060220]
MRRTRRSIRTAAVSAALVSALASAGLSPSVAVAQPETAGVVSAVDIDSRRQLVTVFSPAMDKPIPVQVIRAADTENPRPTMYLLN